MSPLQDEIECDFPSDISCHVPSEFAIGARAFSSEALQRYFEELEISSGFLEGTAEDAGRSTNLEAGCQVQPTRPFLGPARPCSSAAAASPA